MSKHNNKKTRNKKTNSKPQDTSPSYFYWDKEFKSKNGLSLQECYDKFGTKIVMTDKFYYKVIYLDETKDLGNSWMLWSKDVATDRNIHVTLYEKDLSKIFIGDI